MIILRHGHNLGNVLSQLGIRQMEFVGEELRNYGIPVKIISSTSGRASQGAKIVAKILGIPEDSIKYNEYISTDFQDTRDEEIEQILENEWTDGTILLLITHNHNREANYITECAGKKLGHDFGFYTLPSPAWGHGWLVRSEIPEATPFPGKWN